MLALTLVIGMTGFGLDGDKPKPCEAASDGYFAIEHQAGVRWKPCAARIGKERTVRIVIRHASPFIYDYSAEGVDLPTEESAGPLKQLLGLETATKAAQARVESGQAFLSSLSGRELTDATAAQQRLARFVEDLASLDVFRRELVKIVATADGYRARQEVRTKDGGPSDEHINVKTQEDAEKAVKLRLLPRLQLVAAPFIQRVITDDFNAMGANDQAALSDARDAGIQSLAGLVVLYDGLRSYSQGPREVTFSFAGSGDVLVRIKVTTRLSDLGLAPARPTGLLDVAVLHPPFKTLRFSSGIALDVASDPTFRLQSVDAAAGGAPYKIVGDSSVSRLKVTPSVILNIVTPFPSNVSRWVMGGSLGFGIKSTVLKAIDDQTTIGLMYSIGYESLLLSLGLASVARPVGLDGVGADLITSDPNALNNVRTTRTKRFITALHLAF